MKKKKGNNKKILISIIILLIFIAVCIVTVIIKNQKKDTRKTIMGIYDQTQEEIPSLKYSNLSEISEITDNSSDEIDIAKKFRNIFENSIPKLKAEIKDLNDEEIEHYYNENQKEIKEDFYYIEREDFKLLCNKLKEMTSNLEQDFNICDFKAIEDEKLEVTCSYNNGEKLTFKMSANRKIEYK